jgi:hypothetical protein
MQLEGKEQRFVEQEFDATDHALESLLAKM